MSQLYEGLASVLAWLYELTGSYGFSIVLLTLGVRILVTPLTVKGTRSMMAMQKFQPEIRRLQQEHKGDRQRLNEELMRFYRENKINPMGSCLPLLIQMPVFLILYQVVQGITRRGSDGTFNPKYLSEDSELYQKLDGARDMMFLGMDLARSAAGTLQESVVSALPYLMIIAVVTATSYIQQKQVSGRTTGMDINPMQKKLMQFLPLTFAVFSFSFPAALGFYFLTSNVYQVGQQWYISRHLYGMRRGKAPEGATTVVDAPSTEAPTGPQAGGGASPKAPAKRSGSGANNRSSNGRAGGDAGRGGQAAGSGGGRTPAGAKGGRRPSTRPGAGGGGRTTSGRVTEPKRPTGGSPPARQSGGGSSGRGSTSKPGGASRRRVPFGGDGTPANPEDRQKKRRG